MGRFRTFSGRHALEAAAVLVPLLAILVLQYVSNRRLAEVEVIARQTTVARYLEAVAADVRSLYEDAANGMLDVPGNVLAAQRFDEIARHFQRADTSTARLLFAGALDGCLCLTRYYDPRTGTISIGADADADAVAVVLRASTLLRAGTLLSAAERLRLDRGNLYVDETDSENRAVYRFITDGDSTDSDARIVGIVGFVIDAERFASEYLPEAVAGAMGLLPEDVHENVIVRATDGAGHVVTSTREEPGNVDVLRARFEFVFRDWELSARSRHTAAAQVLSSNALASWALTVLMSVSVMGGVLLTWGSVDRERRRSRVRNEFVANVSHEIRTPIASLALFGELLRRGRARSPEKVVEYGRRIEHESDRLRHLIDNVLDFARIESARGEYRPEEAVFEDVVVSAVDAVDGRRERGDFTIAVDWSDTPLPVVSVDKQAMTQVLVNLLDNAMKYSGRSRRIQVRMARYGDDAAVSVTDFGKGIAPHERERIFQRFYRAAAAVDDGVSGTGLGLAIVRHVVAAHGGSVDVDSRCGSGTTFTVRIPAAAGIAGAVSSSASTVKGVRSGILPVGDAVHVAESLPEALPRTAGRAS